MTITGSSIGEALLWCVIGGVAVWLLLTPVRRRSLTGLLTSLVLTGAAASAGALLGAMHAMLVSWSDWKPGDLGRGDRGRCLRSRSPVGPR